MEKCPVTVCLADSDRIFDIQITMYAGKHSAFVRIVDTHTNVVSVRRDETVLKEREIPLILVGDGARLCFESPYFADISCALAPEHLRMQRASGVAEAARQAFLEGKTVPPERLAPIYLRLPQAQRELNKRLAQQKEQQG